MGFKAGVMVEVEAAEELGTGDGLGSGFDGMLLRLISVRRTA